jgi:hypothetical protein
MKHIMSMFLLGMSVNAFAGDPTECAKVWTDKTSYYYKTCIKPSARIGMTSTQVRDETEWGRPEKINKTITARGVREQWVYWSGEYLYFDNGKLTAIQQ